MYWAEGKTFSEEIFYLDSLKILENIYVSVFTQISEPHYFLIYFRLTRTLYICFSPAKMTSHVAPTITIENISKPFPSCWINNTLRSVFQSIVVSSLSPFAMEMTTLIKLNPLLTFIRA